MIWLATAYLGLLAYVGFSSVRSSAREHGRTVTALEAVTSVVWPLLVAAFFFPRVAGLVGRAAAPLYALALTWTLYTVWRDFRPATSLPKLPAENRGAVYAGILVFCALLVVPVAILGAVVARRSLQG